MGIDFTPLLWFGLLCGIVIGGAVMAILYEAPTVDVRIGTVVMEDAGVQP